EMVCVTLPTPTATEAPSAPRPDHARPDHARPDDARRNRGAGAPVLSVKDLKTHFKLDEGVVRAVDGVSFDLHQGEVVGIVGESGCGKSITMKSILRLVQKPGRIVGGEIVYRRP